MLECAKSIIMEEGDNHLPDEYVQKIEINRRLHWGVFNTKTIKITFIRIEITSSMY